MSEQRLTNEITCDTQGHLWSAERCIMCHAPKPRDEPRPSNELLPCPFCGQPPKSGDYSNSDETGEVYAGSFIRCDCATRIYMDADTAEEVAALWNRRAAHEPCAAPDCRSAFEQWLDTPATPADYKREPPFTSPHVHTMFVAFEAGWNSRPAQPPDVWQPIETAPKDGRRILLAANVHSPAGPRLSTGFYSVDPYMHASGQIVGAKEGFQCDGDDCIPSNQKCFTHWAPIPALTKAAELCEECGGSGRLTIYDTATYIGQPCAPIGDEPCPKCSSQGEFGE